MISEWLNWQIIQSVLRNVSQFIGGILLAQGAITSEQNTLLTGAVLSIGALAFSIISSRFKKQAINVAGGKEEVKKVIAEIKVAESLAR